MGPQGMFFFYHVLTKALAAYGQSGQIKEEHWADAPGIDQRDLFEGNSVLRGQNPRVGDGIIE